jgi:hypothetical protein
MPSERLSSFIVGLARQHGIPCARTGSDALADVITRLADDEIVTDETEDLLVALRRANVIDGPMMVLLLGRYLDEQRRV